MPFAVLAPLLCELHDAVVVEVGAFDGSVAERLAGLFAGPPSRWLAFECDPRNLAKCRANPFYARPGVELLPVALGNVDGTATLHPSSAEGREWSASSSVLGPSDQMAANFPWLRYRPEDRLEVPMRTLDGIAAERDIDHVDLLWVDVEGAERLVIEGGRQTLARTRYAFLEVWEARLFEGMWTYGEILAALPDWEVVHRFTGDVLLRRRGA